MKKEKLQWLRTHARTYRALFGEELPVDWFAVMVGSSKGGRKRKTQLENIEKQLLKRVNQYGADLALLRSGGRLDQSHLEREYKAFAAFTADVFKNKWSHSAAARLVNRDHACFHHFKNYHKNK